MPQRNERLGQRFHHVRKTSRLREREPFGRDKKYFHISSSRASTVLKGSLTVKEHTCKGLVGQTLLPVRFCGCEIVSDRQPLAGARDKECLSYRAKQSYPTPRAERRADGHISCYTSLPCHLKSWDNISSPTQAGRSGSRARFTSQMACGLKSVQVTGR